MSLLNKNPKERLSINKVIEYDIIKEGILEIIKELGTNK
jgi:hypothetical protein